MQPNNHSSSGIVSSNHAAHAPSSCYRWRVDSRPNLLAWHQQAPAITVAEPLSTSECGWRAVERSDPDLGRLLVDGHVGMANAQPFEGIGPGFVGLLHRERVFLAVSTNLFSLLRVE